MYLSKGKIKKKSCKLYILYSVKYDQPWVHYYITVIAKKLYNKTREISPFGWQPGLQNVTRWCVHGQLCCHFPSSSARVSFQRRPGKNVPLRRRSARRRRTAYIPVITQPNEEGQAWKQAYAHLLLMRLPTLMAHHNTVTLLIRPLNVNKCLF